MKTIAKLTFLCTLMAVLGIASARAQIPSRILDEQPPPAAPPPAIPVKAPKPAPLFIVNDNIVGYYYLPTATNPGAGQTPKHVLFYTHFDVWAYGTNYVQVEFLKATNGRNPPFGTPEAPCDQGGPAFPPGAQQCSGYSEVYGLWRGTLGWNQIFNTKAYSVGPMTNIEFAFGVDLNWDNTTLASRKRSIQAGLQFDFATPHKGFLNVGVYGYKEWQNDGFAATFPFQPIPNPSGNVDFNPTWAVEINYAQPLGSLPLKYKALVVIHGPKGCGETCQPLGPGLLRTTEYLTQQLLVFDVGQAFWNQPQRFAIFGGYRWWKNKFGIDPNQPNGPFTFTTESTWLMGAAAKF
jgi:hypothetical protein